MSMNASSVNYAAYFKEDQQVKVDLRLAGVKQVDLNCLLRFIEGDQLTIEIMGTESDEVLPIEPGTELKIFTWSGSILCHCNGIVLQKVYGRRLFIKLTGDVTQMQTRREYFRFDVAIPLYYCKSENQLLSEIQNEWVEVNNEVKNIPAPVIVPCADGFKLESWKDFHEIEPVRVNLSGGGMRFKTNEYIDPLSILPVNLFLPLSPPRVICAVAEALRCNEIMLSRGRNSSYVTAMRFCMISDKDRESIIAFIFAEQRRIQHARADMLL